MTAPAPGRYGGKPKPRPRPRPKRPANTAQIRIIAPAELDEKLRQALALVAESLPGWRIARTSQPQPEGDRVRRFIDLEVRDA